MFTKISLIRNLFYILLISLTFFYCTDEKVKPKIDLSIDDENIPTQESWNSEIYFTEEGNLRAILFSNHLMVFDNPKEKILEGVRIEFYNKSGRKTSTLTSKHGKVDDITENMFAIDSVVAINDSAGVTLLTEELMWRKKDKKIVTDKFVTITSEDEVIEGYGLESNQSLSDYVIFDITYRTKLKKEK
ncbi:LPS export ABC transporter periplasmic protein LptC [Bacteroidota bacterium]